MTTPDSIPAGELLAEADTLAPPQPLTYLTGLAQILLADALNLVDGGLAVALTPEVETRLQSAGFHLERALAELGPLTPARQHVSDAAAVGAPDAGEPGPTPHWHDLVQPDFEVPAARPLPSFDATRNGMSHLYDCCSAGPTQPHTADCGLNGS